MFQSWSWQPWHPAANDAGVSARRSPSRFACSYRAATPAQTLSQSQNGWLGVLPFARIHSAKPVTHYHFSNCASGLVTTATIPPVSETWLVSETQTGHPKAARSQNSLAKV